MMKELEEIHLRDPTAMSLWPEQAAGAGRWGLGLPAAKTPREGAAAPGPRHSGTSVRPQSPTQCLFFKKVRNKEARRGFDKLPKNQIKSKNSKNRVRPNGEGPFLESASPRGDRPVSPHPHLVLGPFLLVFHAGTLTPLAGQSPLSSPVHPTITC